MIDKVVTSPKYPLTKEHPYLVKRLQQINGLTKNQIEMIIFTIWDVCGQCKDDDADCQCWNDE